MSVLVPLLFAACIGLPVIALATWGLTPQQRRFILPILLVAFAARVALSVVFATIPSTRIFHEDAYGYENVAVRLARYWMGEGPPVQLSERNYGFPYVLGVVDFLFGRYRLNSTIFNSIIGTLNIAVVFRIGLSLFHEAVARRAAFMVAFFPSMILWSAMALKDTLVSFLICMALLSCIKLRARFSFGAFVGTLIPLLAVYPIRFYLAYFLAAALLGTMAISRPGRLLASFSKQALLVGGLVIVVAAFGLSTSASADLDMFNLEKVSTYRHGMAAANSGFAQDVDISTTSGAILFLPIGVLTLLWSPFPWQMFSLRPLLTLPEMLIWWWLTPSLLRGFWFAMRKRFGDYSPLIVFSATLVVGYALTMGNVGAAYRMRAQVLNVMFLFAALGHYVGVARRRGLDVNQLVSKAGVAPMPAQTGSK